MGRVACAEKGRVVRVARPEQRSRHSDVAKRLAHTLRLGVVEHSSLGGLGASELQVDVLRVASGPLHKFLHTNRYRFVNGS